MDWLVGTAAMLTLLAMLVFLTRLWRRSRLRHYDVPARDVRKGHRWVMVDLFPRATFCCVSELRIVEGAYCDSCGVCVADHCVQVVQ